MNKTIKFGLPALVAIGAVCSLAVPGVLDAAIAASAPLSATQESSRPIPDETLAQSDLDQIRGRFEDAGIDEATGDKLIAKLESGGTLDSSTSAKPTRSFDAIVNGRPAQMAEYADGSRRWVTSSPVKLPSGASGGGVVSAPAAISECTETSGAGSWWFIDCKVMSDDGVTSAGFIVDYKVSQVASIPAAVRNAKGAFCSAIGGTCTVGEATIDIAEASTNPARASMSYVVSGTGGTIGASGSVILEVRGTNATASSTPS